MQQLQLTDQQLYRASGAGDSQAARILARLRRTPGEWVPMPELARIGAGSPDGFCIVHSRAADLRRKLRPRGEDVECRTPPNATHRGAREYRVVQGKAELGTGERG